jgi:hypothetical protein
MSDSYTIQAWEAVKGLRVVYRLYPLIGAGAAGGTLLVNAAGANTFGVDTEIVPATIADEFWFCQVTVTACSVAENYVCSIDTTIHTRVLFQFRCSCTLITPNLAPFEPLYPVRVPPLTQVTGRCASVSGADTVSVSVLVAVGL